MATTSAPPLASAIALDRLAAGWRAVFRTAHEALEAASYALPADEVRARGAELASEVAPTESLLEALAQNWHSPVGHLHLMVSRFEAHRLLGLPPEVSACVFNLDGVLVGSAALHSAAWAATFDEFIAGRTEQTGGQFAPFNPPVDYPQLLHARPRLEGVRAFLASRGIRLGEGDPADAPGTPTVHGLANRKNEALLRRIEAHGVTAFAGSRSYLELAHEAGVLCAVTSASANTARILARAGITDLIDAQVDGNTMRVERLRAKPEPDTLLAACRGLGVEPRHAAAFEATRSGVLASRAAGVDLIVGVDAGDGAAALRAAGADIVVTGVGELLERAIAA